MATTVRPTATEEPSTGRKIALPLLAIGALVALGWGAKVIMYNRNHESTDNAQVDGTIVPVLAKVGGYVRKIEVADNQVVSGGAPLVLIDSSEYVVRLAQAEADYAAAVAAAGARGQAGQAEAAVQTAQSQTRVASAQIDAARVAHTKAAADLARIKDLAAKQIVSKQQLDAVQAANDETAAALAVAERQAATAAAQVTSAEAGTRLAQARLSAARAALDNAKLQLSYTRVSAPFAGTVSRKQVEIGQLIQPGQPLLTIVADTSDYIVANFKETQLSDLKVGQSVAIDVDAYPGCAAEGTLESLSAATGAQFALLPPDNATGNFTKVVQRVPARIRVTRGCGPDRPLRPGMSVTVHVATS
ncbi:MAG: HlyD family secretion protein [Gemmatimonadaceae bacterium]|nr:HlyD family secretion protein [Gemmatimonadaceae bacterium]